MSAPDPKQQRHRVRIGTVLAVLGVFVLLVLPRELGQVTPALLLRIPVEGLVGMGLLLVLPGRVRTVAALLGGAALGVLTVLRLFDIGFHEVLARPFDPVLDWGLFGDAAGYVAETAGPAGAVAAAAAAVLLALAIVGLTAVATVRIATVAARYRRRSAGAVGVLAVAWVACLAVGAQVVAPVPVAARGVAALAYQEARTIPASLHDMQTFTAESAVDAFRDVPATERLARLQGRDVLLTFVESYGRSAIEDPRYARKVDATLDAGTAALGKAGFAARSGFLTSPVAGGGSWLAHATFESGLRIDNQQRHQSLVASDRLTLTRAFAQAQWRTVAVMPGLTKAWPEGRFFGFDRVFDDAAMGYRGLNFSWSPMPDQFTLATFQRAERGVAHPPLAAQIVLTSSHMPWTPVPQLRDWNAIGDGTEYDATALAADAPDVVWQDPERVRTGYADTIAYSLQSLISYVTTYGEDDTVLVFLGDHQPAPIITGANAGRDVPITIVAKDPAVLDRVAGWGWQPGLRPGPGAPVWPMEAFRDHFLSAFGGVPPHPRG